MIRVLIVEDDALIAEAHHSYLGRLDGFTTVAVAHTARDAMRMAAEADPPVDLVLLDLGLPDANGIALASGLSGLSPAPDIIAITSERDLEMVRAAVAHGALAYLLKPFTFAAFRDRLRTRYALAVLDDGANATTHRRVLHGHRDRGDRDNGQQHDEQARLRDDRAEDVDAAGQPRRCDDVDRRRAEDVAGELLEDAACVSAPAAELVDVDVPQDLSAG